MSLLLTQKKEIVSQLHDIVKEALFGVVVDYRGICANEMNEIRMQCRKEEVYIKVIINSLAHRAFESTEFECLKILLNDPVILLFSKTKISELARMIKKFTKYSNFKIKGFSMGETLLGLDRLNDIINLPSHDEALSILLSVMQGSTIKLVRMLKEPYTRLILAKHAILAKKE